MIFPVDRLQEDEIARDRALHLVSFIVEAPAGAGKTGEADAAPAKPAAQGAKQ